MSAPLAGKFQDHYKILEIDPKATLDTIHQAYGKMAEKYHPRNAATGDQDKFDAINLAYEVLCDSGLRHEFDKLKSGGEEKAEFKFSGLEFSRRWGMRQLCARHCFASSTTAAVSSRSRRVFRCEELRACSKAHRRG